MPPEPPPPPHAARESVALAASALELALSKRGVCLPTLLASASAYLGAVSPVRVLIRFSGIESERMLLVLNSNLYI